MTRIAFHKMNGSGNDFIIIDNRQQILPLEDARLFASRVCRRKVSTGADGLILVEDSSEATDFQWRFFNSDGSVAEMCGNGSRCVARFAYEQGICGPEMVFGTMAGIIRAAVHGTRVKVTLPVPTELKLSYGIELAQGPLVISSVNTGVPHVVIPETDLENADVDALGREIRFHPTFSPAGTNVNFVSSEPGGALKIRTYERGVEGETLSCGTGTVAAAVVAVCRGEVSSPVSVITRSGETLTVYVTRKDDRVTEVCLEGGTRLVYEGTLTQEAWQP
jgi:diaminopimelate epimerase